MDSSRPLALSLTVRNAASLANGAPLTFVLDRRDAVIGRAGSTDWTLPDPERHLSSRHCEVRYRDGAYELVDISTNGTFLNGSGDRLPAPHRLSDGDVLVVGPYEIVASLVGAGPSTPPVAPAPAPPAPAAASALVASAAPAPPAAPPAADADGSAPAIPPERAAQREQMWTMFELSNAVDWARGGFGTPPPPAAPPPTPDATPPATPEPEPAEVEPAVAEAGGGESGEAGSAEPVPPDALAPPSGGMAAATEAFLQAVGMQPAQVKQDEVAVLAQAGALLRRLIAGLVVMLEARARAKSQMGAQSTGLEIEGNNPLKFARSPEQALFYMLNPQERGFMSAERAVEDAYRDLQAHQLATLRAMQGALRATLDRFSPKSIRSRADTRGLFARMLPGSRDAALWKAYETEFSGVAFDSDEAFMDIFSKQFRAAYDEIARQK